MYNSVGNGCGKERHSSRQMKLSLSSGQSIMTISSVLILNDQTGMQNKKYVQLISENSLSTVPKLHIC